MTAQPDGDDGGPPPAHRFIEHTSEVILEVRADRWPALLEEAARGLGELARRGAAPAAAPLDERSVTVEAADEAALLVDWLNELIFLAESERWLVEDALVEEADEHTMRALVRGAAVERSPALVKAATLHGLTIQRTHDGVEAAVTLDV